MARKTIHDRLVDALIRAGAEPLPKKNKYTMLKYGTVYYFVGRAGALRTASRANMAISKPAPESIRRAILGDATLNISREWGHA